MYCASRPFPELPQKRIRMRLDTFIPRQKPPAKTQPAVLCSPQNDDSKVRLLILCVYYNYFCNKDLRSFNPEPGDPRTRVKRLMAAAFALTRFIPPRIMGPGSGLKLPTSLLLSIINPSANCTLHANTVPFRLRRSRLKCSLIRRTRCDSNPNFRYLIHAYGAYFPAAKSLNFAVRSAGFASPW